VPVAERHGSSSREYLWAEIVLIVHLAPHTNLTSVDVSEVMLVDVEVVDFTPCVHAAAPGASLELVGVAAVKVVSVHWRKHKEIIWI